jgi:protein TonB
MTTMTFESSSFSPRRAAVRRSAAPTRQAVTAPVAPPAAALVKPVGLGKRNKVGLAALAGITLVLHGAVIVALKHSGESTPLPHVHELAIELAPPPPPPPEPPKVIPKIVKVAPAPVKAAPQMPVVRQVTPVDSTPSTAETVQVATTPAPPVAAPVVVAPPPPAPEPVTEARGYAGYRNNPAPDYPVQAQNRGQQGKVVLNVHVLASGKVGEVTVSKTTGFKILDDSAIKAVMNWSFEPAKRGQTPIDGWVKVPLDFKIS